MTPFQLHPDAKAELHEAAAWYEERRPGLGLDFLREVRRGVREICQAPARSPLWGRGPDRRFLLARFPYWIVYEDLGATVAIKAVAHAKRNPGYWRKRVWR